MPSSTSKRPDFSGVTETPGNQITLEAASMAVSRYTFVRQLAYGRRVLEIACGAGQGIAIVRQCAASVVAGDIAASLLRHARKANGPDQPLVQFDAHHLPFRNGAFDLLQLHEAVYYLRDQPRAFEECRRVLRPGGILVISSINPEWVDFNPSPHATTYLTAGEMHATLAGIFSSVEMSFGFPTASTQRPFVSTLKRAAVRLRLIPKTMAGKRLLKRIFLGRLVTVPPTLTEHLAPVDLPDRNGFYRPAAFKIIYAVATA